MCRSCCNASRRRRNCASTDPGTSPLSLPEAYVSSSGSWTTSSMVLVILILLTTAVGGHLQFDHGGIVAARIGVRRGDTDQLARDDDLVGGVEHVAVHVIGRVGHAHGSPADQRAQSAIQRPGSLVEQACDSHVLSADR